VSLIEEAGLSGPPVGGALTAEGHAVVMGNGTASGEDLTPVSNGPAKLGPATASTDREASAWGIASAKGSQGDRTASALGQVVVMGDEAALRRVVTNLVANAVRHTPPGAPIEIGAARRADGWAVLEVRDHGPGIPAAKRRQVFDRFFRVDGSRSRDSGGTGLGLAIVAGLVDAHNGAVEVADTPGGGATFRVSLPPA
jgi:two-component system OmpR family sensor kinase